MSGNPDSTPAPPTDQCSLFSPELLTDHPVTITPDIEISDENPVCYFENQFGQSTQLATEKYDVSWPPQDDSPAFFRLYGSLSPLRQTNLLQDNIIGTTTPFFPPYFTEVAEYYFWVAKVDSQGNEIYLSDIPVTLVSSSHKTAFLENPISEDCFMPDAAGFNDELEHTIDFARKALKFELQSMGEVGILFLRRYGEDKPFGIPCTCVSKKFNTDPDYQGVGRCKLCFSTGIFGGFYPGISIQFRYAGAPKKKFTWQKRGMQLEHSFSTYTLWAPVLRVEDILVRVSDGSRFFVSERAESSVRGIRTRQEFDLEQIEKKDIRMEVTNASIAAALNQAKIPGFIREGFKSFG